MAPRSQPLRRDEQPAFVLHTYAYRETSLIVEAFTADHGRVAMVARGAKRPRSELRGVLQAFQPLTLSWAGAGEIKTLIRAEWRGGLPLVAGSALLCGFYLNELLLKLLPREDPHPQLFRDYATALAELAAGGGASARCCAASNCACSPSWATRCRSSAMPIPAGRSIRLHGTITHSTAAHAAAGERAAPDLPLAAQNGATLLGLAANAMPDAESAAEAKRLMREVLDHYLEERRIFSRRVVQDLQAIDEESESS